MVSVRHSQSKVKIPAQSLFLLYAGTTRFYCTAFDCTTFDCTAFESNVGHELNLSCRSTHCKHIGLEGFSADGTTLEREVSPMGTEDVEAQVFEFAECESVVLIILADTKL